MKEIIRHNVGDKVIALKSSTNEREQLRIKGKLYTVKATKFCSKCGTQVINIGPKTSRLYVDCFCNSIFDTDGNEWTVSKHFAKPEKLQAKIEEAVEVEDYETAHELTELLK